MGPMMNQGGGGAQVDPDLVHKKLFDGVFEKILSPVCLISRCSDVQTSGRPSSVDLHVQTRHHARRDADVVAPRRETHYGYSSLQVREAAELQRVRLEVVFRIAPERLIVHRQDR